MRVHTLVREQLLPLPPDEVFPFFANAFNLDAITPPLLRFRVVTAARGDARRDDPPAARRLRAELAGPVATMLQ